MVAPRVAQTSMVLLVVMFTMPNGAVFSESRPNRARMTDPPFSKAVLLYSSAKFSCKGTGDGLIWTVEHITLNDTELEERSIVIETKNINSNLSSILIIPALPANDGIEIGCIIFVTTPHFMTAGAKEAVLTVNGVSPVENIKWFSEYDLLTWSPPFFYSKDITAAFVYVIVLNGNVTFNTTGTSMHLEMIANCSKLYVNITVHADRYVSRDNDKISYGNHSVHITNHTEIFDHARNMVNASVVTLVKFSGQTCRNNYTMHIRGTARSSHIKDRHLYPSLEITLSDRGEIVVNYNVTQLHPYGTYKISICLINQFKIIEYQDDIIISTFNVQDFSLNITDETQRSLIVTCMFMKGSITKSCHLIFFDNARGLKQSFNVTGSKKTQLKLKESGNYTVTVYDLVNGSIIGPAITYSKEIELIPSSSSDIVMTTIGPTHTLIPSKGLETTYVILITFGILIILIAIVATFIIIFIILKRRREPHYNDMHQANTNVEEKKELLG